VHLAVFRLAVQHRVASRVKTRQAWHAAVRHTGLLFQLPTPASDGSATFTEAATASSSITSGEGLAAAAPSRGDADGAAVLEPVSALPYPQLSQTVSSANFAPAAHLAEHYSPPGGMLFRHHHAWLHDCPLGVLRADLVSGVDKLAKLCCWLKDRHASIFE